LKYVRKIDLLMKRSKDALSGQVSIRILMPAERRLDCDFPFSQYEIVAVSTCLHSVLAAHIGVSE
jgi:hypothetical protein